MQPHLKTLSGLVLSHRRIPFVFHLFNENVKIHTKLSFFGSQNIVASIIISGVMIIIVSYFLAFLSGMDAKKRILTNIVILAIAVSVTYAIGSVATTLLGVSL